ncbi:hypothetical protein Q31b_32810 [Novipirellula aureliae]|uniref:Uncharacterized protein n=1 Tax=Novipirellula aureliae TaxID=2527966 RepID=A0A5C6DUI6_9BACT|nr:hypothetical protein [Novipirellula aureliae]TWU39965.1 hypothetical protein Q31b_32810 [Novipirellula aureliae]
MSNRQPHTRHPLDHHVRAVPLSEISNSRMTRMECDRKTPSSSRKATDDSEPERQSSWPDRPIATYAPRPSSINIEALDNCYRNLEDYLQNHDDD